MRDFTIGEAAKSVGVNLQTLRYYERRGLLKPFSRRNSGYRIYTMEEVKKLTFIKRAQELGFTLSEIKMLLNLKVTSTARCGDVKRKAELKLAEVKEKIRHLKGISKALSELIDSCREEKLTDQCPILQSLERTNP